MRLPRFPLITMTIHRLPWKWLGAIMLTIILIYGNTLLYEELTRLPPREAVLQGLGKTLNASSYCYHAVATRTLNGSKTVISDLVGEKNLKGVHIKGNLPIINAQVEIYQFGDVMYRQDASNQGWVEVGNKSKASMEQLIAEINPLGMFHFDDNIDVKYAGKEKIGNRSCLVYEIMTRGENKYLELYWQDFKYRLWIDKKEWLIYKAQIIAEHRDNSQHVLGVVIEMNSFDDPLEINPPFEVGKKQ